jgi:hypothetical protein
MLDNAGLATGLETMTATSSEATAIENLAEAYRSYCGAAQANGVIIAGTVLATAKTAMKAAMVGISGTSPPQGAIKIQAGCIAFWASIAPAFTTAWPGSTAMAPPTCVGLSAALAVLFPLITAAEDSLEDAAAKVADEIHKQTAGSLNTNLVGVGTGAVTFPGPTVAPII